MPTQVQYEFDPTGLLAANKVTGETQTLSASAYRDFHFIVPDGAPFFSESAKDHIWYTPIGSSVATKLEEGVHFFFTHRYWEACMSTGKPVYGSISFYDKTMTGTVSLQEYQTVGGNWVLRTQAALEIIFNSLLNPRIVMWSQVVNYPYAFPPTIHDHNIVDMVGMTEMVAGLMAIATAIQTANEAESLYATLEEALLGNRPDRIMSPLMTKLAVQNMLVAFNSGMMKDQFFSSFNAMRDLVIDLVGEGLFIETSTQSTCRLEYSGGDYILRGGPGGHIGGMRLVFPTDVTQTDPPSFPADLWVSVQVTATDMSEVVGNAPVLGDVVTYWTTDGNPPALPVDKLASVSKVATVIATANITDRRVVQRRGYGLAYTYRNPPLEHKESTAQLIVDTEQVMAHKLGPMILQYGYLPETTGLAQWSWVKVSKPQGANVLIQVFNEATDTIALETLEGDILEDVSCDFNIFTELKFVWDGTKWSL